jgi:ABC-type branched-subunit amino acid transport system ATPase component
VTALVESPSGLEAHGVTVRYGGHVALQDLTLRAPLGTITGLIGPNGAGKTTAFNAFSGVVRRTAGRVMLNGVDITALAPQRRADAGLGRTFQRMELFDSSTVRENVALGREALLAGSRPMRHLWATRADRTSIQEATDDALTLCGIAALADRWAVDLSTGQRRLVELARAVAADRSVLLLDEPSSGLDAAETERFGEVLVHLVRSKGVGILLVEHDMSLVMQICRDLFVLDFGRLLFTGSVAEAHRSEVVRRAYLGEEVA